MVGQTILFYDIKWLVFEIKSSTLFAILFMLDTYSNKIANMGIVCAFMVTCIHLGQSVAIDCGSISWWFRQLFAWGVSSLSVPYFFLVSGWLLARHFKEDGYWLRETRKRVKSLLIPLCVWSLIYLLTYRGVAVIYNIIHGRYTLMPCTLCDVLSCFGLNLLANPGVPAGWFLRMLFVLVLLSPVLRRIGIWGISLVAMLYLIVYPMSVSWGESVKYFVRFGFSIEAVLYFTVGMMMREHEYDLRVSRRCSYCALTIGLSLVLLNAVLSVMGLATHGILIQLSIPFNMIALWSVVPDCRFPKWLTSSSMFVFLSHQLLLFLIGIIVGGWSHIGSNIGLYVLDCIFIFAICTLFSGLFHRFLPRLTVVLLGGR